MSSAMRIRTLAYDRDIIEKANKLKDEANSSYSDQDYINAANYYHRCLLVVKGVTDTPLADFVAALGDAAHSSDDEPAEVREERAERALLQAEASSIVAKCYNNLAACILARPGRKSSDYERAIGYCQRVLKVDGSNEKALYRTGIAYMRMEKYSKAMDFFSKCPDNRDAALQLSTCEQKLREDRRARDETIRKNFAKNANRNQQDPPSNGNLLQ